MPHTWIARDRAVLLRDFLRDYCQVYSVLEEQHRRFALSGTLSYAVLRDLVGGDGQNGLFWLLKDSAHHLFRGDEENMAGMLLDWAVGYAFHECIKLMIRSLVRIVDYGSLPRTVSKSKRITDLR